MRILCCKTLEARTHKSSNGSESKPPNTRDDNKSKQLIKKKQVNMGDARGPQKQ